VTLNIDSFRFGVRRKMNDYYSTGRNNNDGQADQLVRKKAKILNIAQRKTEME